MATILESPAVAASNRARAAWYTLLVYSLGHFCVDLYSSALGVFQPLFAQEFGVTLSQAGMLGGMMIFAGSVMQLAWGYFSDRWPSRMFSVLAPGVTAVFISALGLGGNFPMLMLLVALGGSGIASFHPQASVRAAADIEGSRGKAMAAFISSGSLGYAIGPIFFSALLARFGLPSSWWAAIPGVLVTILMVAQIGDLPRLAAVSRKKLDLEPLKAVWKPMTVLYFLVFLRSTIQVAFTQFLPLYLSHERGFTLSQASQALSIYLASGAIGGFAGGHLADRFGGRQVILASMLGSIPFLLLFFFTSGPLAIFGLAMAGLILLCTNPVNIVMAQELAPGASGTVSALMMGFSWGMAGLLFIPLAGVLAESYSLHTVLMWFTVFPAIGFLLARRLPK